MPRPSLRLTQWRRKTSGINILGKFLCICSVERKEVGSKARTCLL